MQTSIGLPTDIALRFGREWVRSLLGELDTLAKAQVMTVFIELVRNAIDANDRVSTDGHIWLCLALHGDSCVLVVQDQGEGFTEDWEPFKPELWLLKDPPDAWAEKQRGILLARSLCDELTYRRHARGWSAKATWRRSDSFTRGGVRTCRKKELAPA